MKELIMENSQITLMRMDQPMFREYLSKLTADERSFFLSHTRHVGTEFVYEPKHTQTKREWRQ